jgi:hypothetical protein
MSSQSGQPSGCSFFASNRSIVLPGFTMAVRDVFPE